MQEAVLQISGHVLGDDPGVFWTPWLGHWTHLTPGDMPALLISRYVQSYEWIKEQTDA